MRNKKIVLIIIGALILLGVAGSFGYRFSFGKPGAGLPFQKEQQTEISKGKEINLKAFNEDFCRSLMPVDLSDVIIEEYYADYHIDGSTGKSVKWVAFQKPSENFNLLEIPELFFVYSDNKFEGCGYKEITESRGAKNELISKFGPLDLCKNQEIHITQDFYQLYARTNLFLPETEDKLTIVKMITMPEFNNKEQILSVLGCEI